MILMFLLTVFANGLFAASEINISAAGAPKILKKGVLFTFESKNADKVYLAGSFNNWADNDNGKVTSAKFEMQKGKGGIWYKVAELKPGVYKYKFVVADSRGNCEWHPDPFVDKKDGDKNSLLDLSNLSSAGKTRTLIKGRELKPLENTEPEEFKKLPGDIYIKNIYLHKIWVAPKEETKVTVYLGNAEKRTKDTSLIFYVEKPDGKTLKHGEIKEIEEKLTFNINSKGFPEGGYIVGFKLKEKERIVDAGYEVLTVAKDISDDLRYGFYANWGVMGEDYGKKADYFARLHINAVEYYDYFPAHGYYAPREKEYKYEPFGIKILGEDVREKIDSAKERNILSIAYVAAYSASASIYKKYPYPMTDKNGVPRIFNGYIMTEEEAKKQNKDIWFYIMAIAKDTKWYSFIMKEFKRVMDDSPDDLVSFDGFEIDSYGHSRDDRYYSKQSKYSGKLLSDIIMGLVGDVRKMAHKIKDKSAVSFNCVNEFGIEKMYDVVDFLFIENWAGYKSGLEDLADMCYEHRSPKNQRVIIKVYPADASPKRKCWTKEDLKYILGATMSGGGSAMVAGEPDEIKDEMHALNTLFYPDNVAIPPENFEILRKYYLFDAIMYRITHGKNVKNMESDFELPGCIVRTFDSGEKYIAVNILHNGENWSWGGKIKTPEMLENYEIAYKMPANKKPLKVYYGTPDFDALIIPRQLDWEIKEGYVRTLIPKLDAFGTLLIQYK